MRKIGTLMAACCFVGALMAACSLSGCFIIDTIGNAVNTIGTNTIGNAVTNVVPSPQENGPQVLWDNVECDWCTHGWEGEDELRMAAINKSREKGYDAIRFNLKHLSNEHLVIALFEWEHPREFRFRLDNFSRRARDRGIKRWVVNLEPGIDPEWVADVFRAYGKGSDFQLQVVSPTKEISDALGLDGQGVKVTQAERRKR